MRDCDDMLRIPPHSIEAEQAVIGGLMLSPKSLDLVADALDETDFYRRDHQLIWRAIAWLAKRSRPFDAVTLGEWFHSQGLGEHVAGGAYLIELASTTPSAANIAAYAEIVREKSTRRKLIDIGMGIANEAFEPNGRPSVELVGNAQTQVGGLLSSEPCDLESVVPVMQRVFDSLQDRYSRGGGIQGITTGISDEFDELLNGLNPGLYILAARPKMGKEQPNSANVRVPGGWKQIGDLKVGDAICSHDGGPSEVVGVYPQGKRETYRLTFADGRIARCGIEHLWEIRHRRWTAPRVIDTRQLSALVRSSPGRYSVRMVSGHFEPPTELPVDPWLVGFLIGDGSLTTSVGFSTADPEILDRVCATVGAEYAIRSYGTCDYRIVTPRGQRNPLRDHLRALGLFGCRSPDKRIPTEYLQSAREQRMELLRGLVDADGWVEKYGCVQIGTSSPGLAGDIRTLVWSLGGKCSLRVKPSKGLDSHVLTLNLGPGQVPAWLGRKVGRLKGGRGDQQWLTVKAVDSEGTEEECTCIKVSHPSELYVTDDYVVTHNTTLAQNIAEYIALKHGKAVAVFSMEMQAEALGERMLSSQGDISASALRSGLLNDDDWTRASNTIRKLRNAPLFISRPRNARVEHIIAQAKRQHAKTPLGLVVIDYLQLIQISGDNRAQGLGEVTRALVVNLAHEIGVPVLLLSQLNRDLERRVDKRPIPADLRDSGAIEQDADAVIFIYDDEVYHPGSPYAGTAELIVALQRNGPSGMVRVLRRKDRFRFEQLPEFWEPERPDPKPEGSGAPRANGFGKRKKAASPRDAAAGE